MQTVTIENLTESLEPVDGDYFIVGSNDMKKISLNNMMKAFLLAAHPVGSIYESEESTSPAELFGGTWEELPDRFLLGAGSTYKAGETGGASKIKVTNENLPSHSHSIPALSGTAASKSLTGAIGNFVAESQSNYKVAASGICSARDFSSSNSGVSAGGQSTSTSVSTRSDFVDIDASHSHTVTTTASTTGSTGSGTAIDIMPPHLVVYMWKRTA